MKFHNSVIPIAIYIFEIFNMFGILLFTQILECKSLRSKLLYVPEVLNVHVNESEKKIYFF